jgi:hypothetical protein
MQSQPEEFGELVGLALSDEQPYAWRAAWLLSNLMMDNDPELRPYIGQMIDLLPVAGESRQRIFLRMLYRMEVDGDNEGRLFDHSLSIWENTKIASGVRANAFKMLLKIARNHPELQREIQFLTEPHYLESLSPGIRHSVLLMMKKTSQNLRAKK